MYDVYVQVDENDPDRALHSLPTNLLVKESDIMEAGLGVFTDKEIQDFDLMTISPL